MNVKKFPIKTELFTVKTELLAEEEFIHHLAECISQKLIKHLPALSASTSELIEEPIKKREVCRILQISDTTAVDWMRRGLLPFHRKGSRVFFFKSEVLKSLEQPLRRGKGRVL